MTSAPNPSAPAIPNPFSPPQTPITQTSTQSAPPIFTESTSTPTKPKDTLYSVPLHQIVLREFLAGFSRALGSLILYGLFIGVLTYYTAKLILPQLQPLIDSVGDLTSVTKQINTSQNDSGLQITPETIDQFKEFINQNP